MDKMDELVPENLTNSLVEEAFPYIWRERKKELRELSKQNLAKEMFGAGAYIPIQQMTIKQVDEAEQNPERKNRQNAG